MLVQGHQAAYVDYFFDILAVNPALIAPDARAAYAGAYASEDALTAGFDFYRAFPQDARDNLKEAGTETRTPALYLRGAGSRGDLESYAQGLRAAGVTKLAARQVPDAGHFIPDEQPAGLWRAIHEFMTTPVDE